MTRRLGKEPDEITTGAAAQILGVHEDTIRRWAIDAEEGKEGARLRHVRRHPITGRFFFLRAEIRRLAGGGF